MKSGVIYALAAAALFGASTPFAKLLVGQIPPITLAGLLYLGSGIGLLSWLLLRRRFSVSGVRKSESFLTRTDLPWLAGQSLSAGLWRHCCSCTGSRIRRHPRPHSCSTWKEYSPRCWPGLFFGRITTPVFSSACCTH